MGLHQILSINVREIRKRNGLTQAELAEKCNISNTFIGEIETGIKYPAPKTLEKIAEALEVMPYVLLIPKDAKISDIDRKELVQKITKDIEKKVLTDIDEIRKSYI